MVTRFLERSPGTMVSAVVLPRVSWLSSCFWKALRSTVAASALALAEGVSWHPCTALRFFRTAGPLFRTVAKVRKKDLTLALLSNRGNLTLFSAL